MKILIIFGFIFTVLLAVAYATPGEMNADEDKALKAFPNQVQCKGQKAVLRGYKHTASKCRKVVRKQTRPRGLKEKENPGKSLGLLRFCIWEEHGIYKNKQVNIGAYEKHIKEMFPGKLGQSLATAIVKECLTTDKTITINKNDLDSIKPAVNCIQRVWKKECTA